MFRKIRNWLNGDTVGAELVGIIGGIASGGLVGKGRNLENLVNKVLTHFNDDKEDNVRIF